MPTDEIVKLSRRQIHRMLRKRQEAAGKDFTGSERRQVPRWPFPGTVEIRHIDPMDGGHWFASCRDISEGGMGMKSDTCFEPGTVLEISVHLPEISFYGRATVRYCKEIESSEYIMGVQFIFDD